MSRYFSGFDVVVLLASMGGVRALPTVLSRLPRDFPAAVIVVQHRAPTTDPTGFSMLLQQQCRLPVNPAADDRAVVPGAVTVAPADRQLTLGEGRVVSLHEPNDRPSGDIVLASAAASSGSRTVGVVLSGRLDDGADGVRAVKGAGGRVLAQDPSDSVAPGMPTAAISTGCVDFVLPLDAIGDALVALTMAPGAAELLRVPVPHWACSLPPRSLLPDFAA